MKTGIITFHKSINYGSALQAWALTYKIKQLGAEAEIIDYEPRNYKKLYGFFFFPFSKKDIGKDLIHLFCLKFFICRKKDFVSFKKKHLPLSNQIYYSNCDLSSFGEDKDVMISGSDQIWNVRAKDFELKYFLGDFPKCKKVSYAASTGQSDFINFKKADDIRTLLLKYNSISVREETSKQAVSALLGNEKKIDINLDPTLLLSKDDYKAITSKCTIKDPYIFFYSVKFNSSAVNSVLKFAKIVGLPIYTLLTLGENENIIKHRTKFHFPKGDVGPSGFLSMIKNAKYVITDSFHGTAFSLIFEKEFWAINDRSRKGLYKDDNRIKHILKVTGLSDRYITEEQIQDVIVRKRIDYTLVNKLISIEKNKSIDYITNAIWE